MLCVSVSLRDNIKRNSCHFIATLFQTIHEAVTTKGKFPPNKNFLKSLYFPMRLDLRLICLPLSKFY